MKYTKIISIIAVLVLIAATFCACEISFGGEQTTTSTQPSTSTEPIAENSTTTATTTTTTVTKAETDSLDTLLNLVKDYPIGTAGSTAKAVSIASRILNFTQNSNFELSEAQKDYENFMATLSEPQKLIYEENLAEIDYVARKIIDDVHYPEKYLSDYTPFAEEGKIEVSNYEALYEVITK